MDEAVRIARNPNVGDINLFVDWSENGLKETRIELPGLFVAQLLHDGGNEALNPDINIGG